MAMGAAWSRALG
jgi:hypothetical protein